MTEVKNILWNLYDNNVEADAFDNAEERALLRKILTSLRGTDREHIIRLRDRALEAGSMEWAVQLSHVVAAMADINLWYGADVSTE